jgi:hypothetical protein
VQGIGALCHTCSTTSSSSWYFCGLCITGRVKSQCKWWVGSCKYRKTSQREWVAWTDSVCLWQAVAVGAVSIVLDVMVLSLNFPNSYREYCITVLLSCMFWCVIWSVTVRGEGVWEYLKVSKSIVIHKKCDKTDCSNYWIISLLSTSYRILSSIFARLTLYADEIIGDHQCGFWRNRSTTDQIFYIWQILEKKWEYNSTVHQLFIDFRKAYNSVRREVLYNNLSFE